MAAGYEINLVIGLLGFLSPSIRPKVRPRLSTASCSHSRRSSMCLVLPTPRLEVIPRQASESVSTRLDSTGQPKSCIKDSRPNASMPAFELA